MKYLLTLLGASLLSMSGCVTDPATGKQSLDPGIRNQLILVAQSEAHMLANDYLTNGSINYKKDLISGALSQVYTLEGTASPLTQANVATVVGNVISDPSMKASVTNSVINTINAVPAGTTKTVAINSALSALDAAVQKYAAAP